MFHLYINVLSIEDRCTLEFAITLVILLFIIISISTFIPISFLSPKLSYICFCVNFRLLFPFPFNSNFNSSFNSNSKFNFNLNVMVSRSGAAFVQCDSVDHKCWHIYSPLLRLLDQTIKRNFYRSNLIDYDWFSSISSYKSVTLCSCYSILPFQSPIIAIGLLRIDQR